MGGKVGLLAVQISNPAAHRPMPGRSGLWGIVILGVGVALICHGVVPMIRSRRWRTQAFAAQGRVVDNVPQPAGRHRTTWLPIVEFEADGVMVTSPIPAAATLHGRELGDAVEVLYDPSDPHRTGLADARLTVSRSLMIGLAVVGIFLAVVT